MNKELIAKVIQSIVDQPDKHEQDSWVRVVSEVEVLPQFESPSPESPEVPIDNLLTLDGACETSACIAGWAMLHEGYIAEVPELFDYGNIRVQHIKSPDGDRFSHDHIGDEAAQLMGIGDQPYGQLFYDMNDESALAQLMFLYEKGHLPHVEVLSYEDHGEGEGVFVPDNIQDYEREDLTFDGEDAETFVSVWTRVANEKFPPTPIQTTLPI